MGGMTTRLGTSIPPIVTGEKRTFTALALAAARASAVNVLFSPVTIGGMEVPNRVVMPPMTTRLADPDGYATDALVAYYKARALGGRSEEHTSELQSPCN